MKKLFILFCVISFNLYSLLEHPFPFQLENEQKNDPKIARLIQRACRLSEKSVDWCTKEKTKAIVALVLNTKPLLSVEIGVFGGSSFLPIVLSMNYNNIGKTVGIDSWNNNHCVRYMDNDDPNKAWWSTLDLNSIYQSFYKISKDQELLPSFTIHRQDSLKAAQKFDDESIEFLHFDGNHAYEGVLKEFQSFLPKVKKGGYILVSDLMWFDGKGNPIHEAANFLFEFCDLIEDLDDCNVLLFKKRDE